jgi:hypothetical protein
MVSTGADSVDAALWKRSQKSQAASANPSLPEKLRRPRPLDICQCFTEHQIDLHGSTRLEALPVWQAGDHDVAAPNGSAAQLADIVRR